MRNDMLDVVKKRLEETGLSPIFTTMADARRHPESVTLAYGVPTPSVDYMDGGGEDSQRITVLCRRISEEDAIKDATSAYDVFRRGCLDSENGSYGLLSIEATKPQPIPWDESGRYVWAAEASITTTRKDFF